MDIPTTTASTSTLLRMGRSMLGQKQASLRCPAEPRLEGTLALVTGATGGIGLETARGLLARGAAVLLACRDAAKGHAVADALAADAEERARLNVAAVDLADLNTLPQGLAQVEAWAAGRPIDVLVENAGVWPQRYATTAQGYELASGTNVLGHFALRQGLFGRQLLAPTARVIVLTGDIYVMAPACTTDYQWQGAAGGMRAYCRSKLGNIWIARELHRRQPQLAVHIVHPGVVHTGLGGSQGAARRWLSERLMIDAAAGAQTTLICATQPDLVNGGYYHNTQGLMSWPPQDPALMEAEARNLWKDCEDALARHAASAAPAPV